MEIEVLVNDTYKNYQYLVVQGPFCKCAYVRIPETHPFYRKSYDEVMDDETIYIPHGGFTYSEDKNCHFPSDEWHLGWDYGHRMETILGREIDDGYSLEDIIDEAKEVIDSLEKK